MFAPCENLCSEKHTLQIPALVLWELWVKHSKAVDCNSASRIQAGFSPLAEKSTFVAVHVYVNRTSERNEVPDLLA